MTVAPHNIRIFLSVLLISVFAATYNAQQGRTDTLKKVSADTLEASEETLAEQVKYFARDSTVALPGKNRALLYGEAWVEYGGMKMKAAVMEIDYNTNIVKAYGATDTLGHRVGNPSFTEGSETMEADTIKYNLKTKKGKIYNALTKQGELLVVGNEIKKDSNEVIYMKNMKCIPCQEADAKTVFRASRAKIIPDDKIVTGPMYLEIAGVPTPLGLPFGYFPNTKKQHNGILLPQYGYSEELGFFLRDGGLYLGFNDKTDMEIRSSVWGNGSFMLSTENRYKVLYKYRGSTNLSFSHFVTGEKEIPSDALSRNRFSRELAYAIGWEHDQDNKSDPSRRFGADVDFRKNQAFNRLNSVNSGQYLENTFQSNISFTKSWKFGALSLNGMHSQNSNTGRMDITLPSLTFNINRFNPFKRKDASRQNVFDKIQAHYLLQASNVLSGHEDSIFSGDISRRMRNGLRHSLPIQTNFSLFRYITVTPALNFTGVMYASTTRRDVVYSPEGKPTFFQRTVKRPAAGFDGTFNTAFNTQVYFDYVFKKGKTRQIRHLMIPTLNYSYRPDFGAAHFGTWKEVLRDTLGNTARYSIFERGVFGGPGQGELNGLSINLNNNIEGKFRQRSDTGVSFVKKTIIQNISMTGGYNFAADSFKMSDLGLSMRTTVLKHILVNVSSQFSPYAYDRVNRRELSSYVWGSGRALRFQDASITLNSRIGSDMLEAMRELAHSTDLSNAAERGGEVKIDDPPETLPWSLTLGYNLSLSKLYDLRVQPTHAIDMSADMMPTKFWKVGISSGFDFNTLQLRQTRVTIYRDLKCWEATITWVPFGIAKSYMVGLNMKMSMLRDIRIPRQRQWYDQFQ